MVNFSSVSRSTTSNSQVTTICLLEHWSSLKYIEILLWNSTILDLKTDLKKVQFRKVWLRQRRFHRRIPKAEVTLRLNLDLGAYMHRKNPFRLKKNSDSIFFYKPACRISLCSAPNFDKQTVSTLLEVYSVVELTKKNSGTFPCPRSLSQHILNYIISSVIIRSSSKHSDWFSLMIYWRTDV